MGQRNPAPSCTDGFSTPTKSWDLYHPVGPDPRVSHDLPWKKTHDDEMSKNKLYPLVMTNIAKITMLLIGKFQLFLWQFEP